jgi:hypothetical protein
VTTAVSALPAPVGAPTLRVGRAFVHPAFDLFIIGGGLSLIFTVLLLAGTREPVLQVLTPWLALLVLLSNSSHFAASTVRLYTKPDAPRELRFLVMGFPLVVLGVLTAAIAFPERLGSALMTLYLTWSPFHYSAQAYGLALMYSYRSGCALEAGEKRALRLACLAPFFAVLAAGRGVGLDWLSSGGLLAGPSADSARLWLVTLFGWVTVGVPLGVFLRLLWARRTTLPLISLCVVVSNGVWLIALNRLDAFAYATIFHGLQYLAIVSIFHVKDRLREPGNRRGWAWHTAGFYLACLGLGYLLFQVWPFAYVLLGFGLAESALLVTAIINLHHFIVDAYIWKLRQDANYRIVTDAV